MPNLYAAKRLNIRAVIDLWREQKPALEELVQAVAAACQEAERFNDHKIVVTHVRPPIPNADHFAAYSDSRGADDSPYGTGPDAASAIEDLMRQLEELEDV